MASKTTKTTATKTGAASVAKPARKGTARTTRPKTEGGTAGAVRTRKMTKAERANGTAAKLSKPTARRAAAKPTAKPTAARKPSTKAGAGSGGISPATATALGKVAKLRASGTKWDEVADATGLSLSALARLRKIERTLGASRF